MRRARIISGISVKEKMESSNNDGWFIVGGNVVLLHVIHE